MQNQLSTMFSDFTESGQSCRTLTAFDPRSGFWHCPFCLKDLPGQLKNQPLEQISFFHTL
jgi:hypothetical protein